MKDNKKGCPRCLRRLRDNKPFRTDKHYHYCKLCGKMYTTIKSNEWESEKHDNL